MARGLRPCLAAAALLAVAGPASAQFAQQNGVVVGPTVWSSGVVTADLDGDDDLDIVYSNGVGFFSAGTPQAPTLLINNGVSGGNPNFTNETGTRFPAFTQNAKGCVPFDMDNDGDKDLFFANAFNKQQRLLENNGSGFFTDVTAANFTTITMNSFAAVAFDMDNDGDLDLAVCDNQGTSLSSTGRPRLFENDGTGDFTEVTNTNFPLQTKSSQQNFTAVDIDNDMDLDLVLDGRSTPQRLYINDGTGDFTLLNGALPNGSNNCYETDWADLDGDGDIDGFYISLSGFLEGTAQNRFAQSGNLVFTGSTNTLIGTNTGDDNECLFVDYDNDGDLDPVVAALGQQREKLYRNNGNFTFTSQNTFSNQSDSSLDMTVGDFDNDGDYDAVTAQGESGNFLNRYYRNNGPADTTAPNIVRTDVSSATVGSPMVVRATVTDSTMDDGDQFVDCALNYTVTPKTGAPVNGSVAMLYSGGSIYRGEIDSGLSDDDLLGAAVSYTITATDFVGNMVTSPADNFFACGGIEYGPGTGANVLSLSLNNVPAIGGTAAIGVSGGQASATGVFVLGVGRASIPSLGGTLLVTPALTFAIGVGPGGNLNLNAPIPNDSGLLGQVFNLQVILADGTQAFGAAFSNGLEMSICDS